MRKLILYSTLTLTFLNSAAYKLPEQSLKGTALSAANIASCEGADCAFYNSANIAFLENKNFLETGITFIHLPSIEFKGTTQVSSQNVVSNAKSKVENIAIAYFHYVSPFFNNLRYSLSITTPGGLRKRWNTPVEQLYAKEFELKTIALTPSLAYKINNNFAISTGINIVYSEGKVKNDGNLLGLAIKRNMRGDSIDFSFNIAASWHLDNGLKIATTYNSKTKLSEEGEANLYLGAIGKQYKSKVDIYLPATFKFAIAKEFDKINLEFVYERTFWSSYKELLFKYSPTINNPILYSAFATPKKKLWKNTNTFRLGLEYKYSNKLSLLAGYSYDQTPIKDEYLSYELPDSNANIFSAGFIYKYSKNLSFGVSLLYDKKRKRKINSSYTHINGEFSKGGALLITSGVLYKF